VLLLLLFVSPRARSNFYSAGESIGFHWDKDETLADVHGIKAYPQVSTVTYLSGAGAPTVVLQHTRNNIPGSHSVASGFVSHPAVGKHISFDGRLLHGVPAEISDSATPPAYTRVTFLANVWINHALVGIQALPEHLAQQMCSARYFPPFSCSVTNAPCPAQASALWRLFLRRRSRAARALCSHQQVHPRARLVVRRAWPRLRAVDARAS
jgi:hypothetical protein